MKIGNLNVYGIVYKITNKINKKVYIGITKQKNGFKDRYNHSGKGIERVYRYHKKCNEKNIYYNKELLYDIEYYGFNAFEVIEIFDVAFTMEELKIKEKSWIAIYDSFNNGYNGDEGGIYNGDSTATTIKKVICLNTMEIFDIAKYGAEKYNIDYIQSIRDCCKGIDSRGVNIYSCGTLENGTPLVWRYYEDYLNMSEENIKEAIEKAIYSNNTAVVCLNTREIFKTTKEADKKYNCYGGINKVCNKNRRNCGKLEDGTRLTWVYYEDYINMTEEDIQERIVWSQSSDSKKVRCIDMDVIFETIADCSRKLNIDRKSIRQCCNKTRKTAKGHRFEFYFEEEIA